MVFVVDYVAKSHRVQNLPTSSSFLNKRKWHFEKKSLASFFFKWNERPSWLRVLGLLGISYSEVKIEWNIKVTNQSLWALWDLHKAWCNSFKLLPWYSQVHAYLHDVMLQKGTVCLGQIIGTSHGSINDYSRDLQV